MLAVSNGFAEVVDNVMTVLADRAEFAEEIAIDQAHAALRAAEDSLKLLLAQTQLLPKPPTAWRRSRSRWLAGMSLIKRMEKAITNRYAFLCLVNVLLLGLVRRSGQHAQFLRHRAHGHWTGVRPFQICFRWRAYGCRTRLKKIAGDKKLIRVEKPLDALVLVVERGEQLFALVRVTQELVDGLSQRILDARAFELCNY